MTRSRRSMSPPKCAGWTWPMARKVAQGARGVGNRLENLLQAAAAVVLDDDAGARADVGLEIGVGAARIATADRDARLVDAAGERPVLDDELDLEARMQD